MTLKINTECPSSLSVPSKCTDTAFYKENCVAYCEQFLYWFFADEVPFRGTTCEPYDSCEYAGAKGVSITNSFTFNGGVDIGGKSGDVLEAAFNLGASYTYSKTTTTSHTFTSKRPNATLPYCGYWTFLPYYVQSCGFYVSTEKQYYGATIYGNPYSYCDSKNPTVIYLCNNSTITDEEGNAEGVTFFVATHCENNTLAPPEVQDARLRVRDFYILLSLPDSEYTFINGLLEHYVFYEQSTAALEGEGALSAQPTCDRGCLCGYAGNFDSINEPHGVRWPYASCGSCNSSFVSVFAKYGDNPPTCDNRNDFGEVQDNELGMSLFLCRVPVSPTNITLMLEYGVNLTHWLDQEYIIEVEEGDPGVIKNPYECFIETYPPNNTIYPCGPYGDNFSSLLNITNRTSTIEEVSFNHSKNSHLCGSGFFS
ncbi:MAG: hypothetical protein M1836_000031 [Candelina mexicana]|nr:MAG: hypothetical protein M1836_000031 [Candelina mexicana]